MRLVGYVDNLLTIGYRTMTLRPARSIVKPLS
nr:MAG TPA: hypothetical protein [Caudoviricetes sp.]